MAFGITGTTVGASRRIEVITNQFAVLAKLTAAVHVHSVLTRF